MLMGIAVIGGSIFGLVMLLADLVMMKHDLTNKITIR